MTRTTSQRKAAAGSAGLERDLREQARAFAGLLAGDAAAAHNCRSIVLALTGHDIGAGGAATREQAALVVAKLSAAAVRERQRARSRHGDYDLNRHIALNQAMKWFASRGGPAPTGLPRGKRGER